MNTERKRSLILLGLLVFVLCFSSYLLMSPNLNERSTDIELKSESNYEAEPLGKPKVSGAWIRTTQIFINDTSPTSDWAWAVGEAWCSGAGSEGDPYLLENITITKTDGNASIHIVNSPSGVYFTLNNVTLRDSSDGGIGVYLVNTSNGRITNSNCSLNARSGIEIIDTNSTTIISNEIASNTVYGITIYESAQLSESNSIYANDFDNNGINGQDNSTTANTWDNGTNSGNEWDDYGGVDADDDGIGDTAYSIDGSASAEDRYPVWDDGDDIAPAITINTPTANQIIGIAPTFTLTIVEVVGVFNRWYTLNGGTNNQTFTGTSGTITGTEWDRHTGLPGQRVAVVIIFFGNDTSGNIGSASVTVQKQIPGLAIEYGEDDEDIYTYALSQNQIFILSGFALALSLALRLVLVRSKRT